MNLHELERWTQLYINAQLLLHNLVYTVYTKM